MKVDQAKVADELKNLKTQAGDDAAWQKQLKDAGATEADYTDTFAVQQLAQGLYDKLTKASAAVTDAEIQAQYDKDKATVYKVAASRKVEHILFGPRTAPRRPPRTCRSTRRPPRPSSGSSTRAPTSQSWSTSTRSTRARRRTRASTTSRPPASTPTSPRPPTR